ncbi:MAG TPA: Xaa-Pro peptidase family protein [Symbiobacteriaceae bacterium]|nr:Xaa-Pro peptidase family protein [Symbiobacteriaceae bacterium]
MSFTPKAELDRRLATLRQHLAAAGLDGALLHGVTNLFYYTGTAQQGHLWVPAAGEPVLLVRRVLERARQESALERLEPLTSLRNLAGQLGGARRIGMELDILPVTLFQTYQKALPGAELTDIGAVTRLARSVKSPYEVEQIRTAAHMADETYRAVQGALRPGITELDLSVVAEAAERRAGHSGALRWRAATGFECPRVHLLAGESALAFSFADTPFGGEGLTPAVPYGAGRRVIERGMPVCLDYPTVYGGYIHDQTRTLAIGGLDAELTRAYEVCREILAALEAETRPGVTGHELWEKTLAVAVRHGLEEQYMGCGANRVRFIGHGVGLELDELPVLAPRQTQVFAAGNVIAVEPKFFFPGKGAVGLENTYLVTPTGLDRLTVSSDELCVV